MQVARNLGLSLLVDFGLENTVITHRPELAQVVQTLVDKIFPGATLRSGSLLASDVDVHVALGRDLLQRKETLAKLAD